MKRMLAAMLTGLCWISPVMAQMDFPGNPTVTPKKFTTRSIGGSTNTGATVVPAKTSQNVRHVTHIVLYDYRMWSNTEGKPLEAKLIAFEDLVTEAPAGAAEPAMPAPPANPTLIRDGRIRLLVDKKPVVVPLEKLSEADREFIGRMKAALDRKAAEGH